MCEDCQRLKRAVIRLRNDLKHERRKNATLLSEKKRKTTSERDKSEENTDFTVSSSSKFLHIQIES
jgi:hypothetical protein